MTTLTFKVHNIRWLSHYDTCRSPGSCHYQEIKTSWYWLHRIGMSYVYTKSMEAVINNGRNKRPCANGVIIMSYPTYKRSPSPRGGYSSSSRAGRLGRTLWPQNSTSVAETEKGGQNSTMTPTTLEKGVNILHQYEKSAKKGGQKSTILKNIGVKILQVWKWGSKFYMLKNRGQNSTMLEKRGSIFYIRPQK